LACWPSKRETASSQERNGEFEGSCARKQKRSLEPLTKPLLDEVPTDEYAADGEEGLVDIGLPFVTDSQAAKPIESGEGALYHPTEPTRFPGLTAATELPADLGGVVGFIRDHHYRPTAKSA